MDNYLKSSNAGQGMGVAALVLGILTVLVSFVPCVGVAAIFLGVIAIVLGIISYTTAKKGNAPTGMPIAGLILGVVGTIFASMWILFFVVAANANPLPDENEIGATLDSINKESMKLQDSLDKSLKTIEDSLKIEELK